MFKPIGLIIMGGQLKIKKLVKLYLFDSSKAFWELEKMHISFHP